MASIVLRSRLLSRLAKFRSRNPRLYSTEASNSASRVEGISAGQSIFSDLPPPNLPPPPPQAEAAASGKRGKGLKFLSYGLAWALTGATAATGYVSYGMCTCIFIE